MSAPAPKPTVNARSLRFRPRDRIEENPDSQAKIKGRSPAAPPEGEVAAVDFLAKLRAWSRDRGRGVLAVPQPVTVCVAVCQPACRAILRC